ncbi:hypothetical protein F7725_007343 [Dissostichus mawsoni]|uniref:Uncharacterized protein n=1 Tax=Dissostichus mawsoni TaxID=36200 RepID=A0A7J5XX53_DISMA|nr:hypothetical protein F7725_007343 [Dissostichus mawsoni]
METISGTLLLTLLRLTLALNAHGGFYSCILFPDAILFLPYVGLAKRLLMPEASKGCRELIKCKCKKRCAGNCKCSAANLPCTELCSCSGQCFQDEQ